MKNIFISKPKILLVFSLFLVTLIGCINVAQKKSPQQTYTDVKISKVLECDCDIRALNVDQQHIFFAGSNGKFGYLNTADHSTEHIGTISEDGDYPEFRGLTHTKKNDFILSAGNPALIYKVNFFGKRKRLFKQTTKGTFYDAMAFWNDKEGLIIGDPTDGCMAFSVTRDAGSTWDPISCKNLPKAKKNEAAFAASNSNIAIVGDKTWVVSGGNGSRVYFSPDKGKTWEVFDTPLIDDSVTAGGYTIDFYDDKIGVIFGGDFTDPKKNKANKALTLDGGKTWKLIADGEGPPYKSIVKFVPNSGGKEIVAVGITGISYSSDQGKTWTQLSDKSFYTIDFLNDFTAYAAGQGEIVQLTFLESDL